jgi:hypothetical protein
VLLQSPSRIEELVSIFIHATNVRLSFLAAGEMINRFSDGERLLGLRLSKEMNMIY